MASALAIVQYIGDGSTNTFSVPFPYIDKTHVVTTVDGDVVSPSFVTDTNIQISPTPAVGAIVDIRRDTPKATRLVDFNDGSILTERDLDLSALQVFYIAQESFDLAGGTILVNADGSYNANTRRITNLGEPVDSGDAVSKDWAQTAMSSQLSQATAAKNAASSSATAAAGSATASTNSATASASSATGSQNSRLASEAARDASAASALDAELYADQAFASAATAQAVSGDVPSLPGNAGRLLRVNTGEDGYDFQHIQSSPTDNTPGVLLTPGAFGIGGNSVTVGNPDDVFDSGFYRSATGVNMPDGAIAAFIHERYSTNAHRQVSWKAGFNFLNTYTRVYASGSWQPWEQYLTYTGGALPALDGSSLTGFNKILAYESFIDNSTYSTSSSSFTVMGDSTNYSPSSPNSRLLITATAYGEAVSSGTNANASFRLSYFDGTAYQGLTEIYQLRNSVSGASGGTNLIRGMVSTTYLAGNSVKRADNGQWRIRWQGAGTTGTATMYSARFTFIEVL